MVRTVSRVVFPISRLVRASRLTGRTGGLPISPSPKFSGERRGGGFKQNKPNLNLGAFVKTRKLSLLSMHGDLRLFRRSPYGERGPARTYSPPCRPHRTSQSESRLGPSVDPSHSLKRHKNLSFCNLPAESSLERRNGMKTDAQHCEKFSEKKLFFLVWEKKNAVSLRGATRNRRSGQLENPVIAFRNQEQCSSMQKKRLTT